MMVWNPFRHSCFADGSAWTNENRITFSSLKDISILKYQAPTYGIKYVIQGTEHYILGNKDYPVSAGHFLLVNNDETVDIAIRSSENVTGLCIHLESSIMRDLHAQLTSTEEQLLVKPTSEGHNPELEPLLYTNKENKLGKHLRNLAALFIAQKTDSIIDPNALYYNLGTEMLLLQTPKTKLTVMRNSTKTELVRRLSIARSYIVAHALQAVDINEVAKEAMMSAPHLYRSFKKLYGLSPYQYATYLRLQKARQLLGSGCIPSEVYANCGYADLPSFSKAFKKVFGASPSEQGLESIK